MVKKIKLTSDFSMAISLYFILFSLLSDFMKTVDGLSQVCKNPEDTASLRISLKEKVKNCKSLQM